MTIEMSLFSWGGNHPTTPLNIIKYLFIIKDEIIF